MSNQNYRLNAGYALNKAKAAVKSWQDALTANQKANNVEGIDFCEKSLAASRESLARVEKSVKEWWMWN